LPKISTPNSVDSIKQDSEFGAAAARRFKEFAESGDGDLDFSAIYRHIRH